MPPQTVQIETVQVIRPIKVLALVCGIIGLILLIISIAASNWVQAHYYNQGLWQTCRYDPAEEINNCDSNGQAWIRACAALCLISLVICCVAIILNALGLATKDREKKKLYYDIAKYIMFAACGCLVIALIVFPIMFIQELDSKSAEENISEWYFAWAYGIGWGAAVFQAGAAILLLIDKEEDEIYYKEKTTYQSSPYQGSGYDYQT